MNENNDFALVPKSPNSIEMAEPGARRIMSAMIADALILAKEIPLAYRPGKRPLKIVMMDDEPFVLKHVEALLQPACKNATFRTFTDAKLAYQELMRESPDLFITDVCHPPPDGFELLRLLAERKVKYPIFVISGFAKEKEVLPHAGSELNVAFFSKPFSAVQFLRAVEAALSIPA